MNEIQKCQKMYLFTNSSEYFYKSNFNACWKVFVVGSLCVVLLVCLCAAKFILAWLFANQVDFVHS